MSTTQKQDWKWTESTDHVLSIWDGDRLIALKQNATAEDVANFILMRSAPKLLAALNILLNNRGTIEVLGEWEALELNARGRERERAKMEAIYDECRAAIAEAVS